MQIVSVVRLVTKPTTARAAVLINADMLAPKPRLVGLPLPHTWQQRIVRVVDALGSFCGVDVLMIAVFLQVANAENKIAGIIMPVYA